MQFWSSFLKNNTKSDMIQVNFIQDPKTVINIQFHAVFNFFFLSIYCFYVDQCKYEHYSLQPLILPP